MTGPTAARLPGDRLHLQHGPIELVIAAEGERDAAFRAAIERFGTLLEELVAELPALRAPAPPNVPLRGETARIMAEAVAPHSDSYVTPMAAVAGAVAQTVLAAMTKAARLRRAHVNNGGDIALHLAAGESCRAAIAGIDGAGIGRIEIAAAQPVRGIATSGRAGRSLSMGIADSVTVLAHDASAADVAATLIANAVNLPGHPAIGRTPASRLAPDSDLGDRPVVTACGPLAPAEIDRALDAGARRAQAMRGAGLITAAALFLRGGTRMIGPVETATRSLTHA